jgi:hypothetical protein
VIQGRISLINLSGDSVKASGHEFDTRYSIYNLEYINVSKAEKFGCGTESISGKRVLPLLRL